MRNVQFSSLDDWWADYRDVLPEAFDTVGLKTLLAREIAPTEVDYLIFAANGPVQDLTPYSRLKAVLNLWAGVEEALKNHTLSQPLVRMVDPGLTEGMVDWVVGHVMRLHLGMDVHLFGQDGEWRKKAPPLAREQKITIMSLGELGQACAKALAGLNFQVSGWSRTLKDVPRVKSLAGNDGFKTALADGTFEEVYHFI